MNATEIHEVVFQLVADGARTETEIAVRGDIRLADVYDALNFLGLEGRVSADEDGGIRVWEVIR